MAELAPVLEPDGAAEDADQAVQRAAFVAKSIVRTDSRGRVQAGEYAPVDIYGIGGEKGVAERLVDEHKADVNAGGDAKIEQGVGQAAAVVEASKGDFVRAAVTDAAREGVHLNLGGEVNPYPSSVAATHETMHRIVEQQQQQPPAPGGKV